MQVEDKTQLVKDIIPKAPTIITRKQFIYSMKKRLPWSFIHPGLGGSRENGNPKHCPWCEKGLYQKLMVLYNITEEEHVNMGHFDNCIGLKNMWKEYNQEQRQSLQKWEEMATRMLVAVTKN